MSMIIGENVSHAFGAHEVFHSTSFRLAPTDRVGLVGPNGEGKTTLLKIMGGLLDSTGGTVHRARGLRLGYLPQVPPQREQGTIFEAMLEVFADLRQMEADLADLATRLEASGGAPGDLLRQYGSLQAKFETLGGHGYTTRIEQVLSGLGFPQAMWSQPVDQLSGGQRTRVYLAELLLRDPQLLMLDEPTNHLDLDSVEWLEYWLRSFRGALVVVSHDRYFLDRVTSDTWEVAFGGVETYHGSYSAYLTQRAERHKERMRQWEEQQEYVAKTEEFIARHLAGQRSKEAKGRRTRLERFMRDDAIARPREHEKITLHLEADGRTGDLVLRAEDLVVGYAAAAPLVKVDRLEVRRGQRVAIVGPNGCGKTTLVRTILGELAPLGGTVQFGANVNVGYLSQNHSELDPESRVIDLVMAADRHVTEEEARTLLGSLLLSGDESFKRLSQLSGGQRSRVVLARLVLMSANVLLLDEPTNHLDIPSREIIQSVLQNFAGTVFLVSHDRYLIQSVATDVWAVGGGGLRAITGGWEEYVVWRSKQQAQQATAAEASKAARAAAPPPSTRREDRKADYRAARKQSNIKRRLKTRHEQIEQEIGALEAELASLMQAISAAGQAANLARVDELSRTYQSRDAHLKELWAEWEEVGQQLE